MDSFGQNISLCFIVLINICFSFISRWGGFIDRFFFLKFFHLSNENKGENGSTENELAHVAAARFTGSPEPHVVTCSYPIHIPCFIWDLWLEGDLRRKEVPDVSHVQYFFECDSYLIKDQTEGKGNSFSFDLYIVELFFFLLLVAMIFTVSLTRYHLI